MVGKSDDTHAGGIFGSRHGFIPCAATEQEQIAGMSEARTIIDDAHHIAENVVDQNRCPPHPGILQ
jgi:hypothetical protein